MANEKRLTDANAFLKDILTAGIGKTIIEYSESDIGYMIRKRPTVDAVPVVRCRECVHNGLPTCFTCYIEQHELIFLNHDPEFFCGAGERKDGDGNG